MVRSSLVYFLTIAILKSKGDDITNYNRSMLQEKYPGYGEKYVFFPGEVNPKDYKVGFLKADDRISWPFYSEADLNRDVHFTLFTREQPKGYRIVNHQSIKNSTFNKSKKTKFVTHGWLSSGQSESCVEIKDNYLKKEDLNVFIMDWNAISGNILYPIPMKATSAVGGYYSNFLNYLINDIQVDPKDLHLIGHSLGAHISGFAARGVKKSKIARVTGLDPALPGFNVGMVDGNSISKFDADFVDVIHTCGGFLGFEKPLGHADFYPNGGNPPQPGCGNILEMIEACSHGRSYKLFAESIILMKPAILASPCASIIGFSLNQCKGEKVPIGDPTPTSARGIYYLVTNHEAPFLGFDESSFISDNSV